MLITYLNPVWCQVSKEGVPILKQVLFYPDTYWRQGPFRKISKPYKHFLIGKDGKFLTGFMPRALRFLNDRKILYTYTFNSVESKPFPKIKGILTHQLRPEQEEAVNLSIENVRGVIHYPTGSGKTVIFLSIIEALQGTTVLILLHRQDLLYQTYDRAKEMFPGKVGIVGDGKTDPNQITIAMIQSMATLDLDKFGKMVDVLIVDEAHHVSTFKCQYYHVLTQIQAPMRLGFTATLPHTREGEMALEGLVGPVIAQKKISEVQSLAKPVIKLRKIPFSQTVHNLTRWKDVYKIGVVHNPRRHSRVLEDAAKLVGQGKTVLILVVEIEHGNKIMEMAKKKFSDLRIFFVWGNTPSNLRNQIRKLLDQKKYDVVVVNVVWREGVDIPSLGAIINACGGKSEIMTLQSLGRGLRTTADKKEVILVDYFDPSHHYLISHFGERLTLYFDEGWL